MEGMLALFLALGATRTEAVECVWRAHGKFIPNDPDALLVGAEDVLEQVRRGR